MGKSSIITHFEQKLVKQHSIYYWISCIWVDTLDKVNNFVYYINQWENPLLSPTLVHFEQNTNETILPSMYNYISCIWVEKLDNFVYYRSQWKNPLLSLTKPFFPKVQLINFYSKDSNATYPVIHGPRWVIIGDFPIDFCSKQNCLIIINLFSSLYKIMLFYYGISWNIGKSGLVSDNRGFSHWLL